MNKNYSFKSANESNIKVMIRIRPPFESEIELEHSFRSITEVDESNTSLSLVQYMGIKETEEEKQQELITSPSLFKRHIFTFDQIFDFDTKQETVYTIAAKPAVLSILDGYNSTIFAYGQTGTGKTYTMEGIFDSASIDNTYNNTESSCPNRGIIPRCVEDIFHQTENAPNKKYIIKAK